MVATGWLGRAVAVAALSLLASSAQALTLNLLVAGGGIEGSTDSTYGCPTASGTCTLAQRDFALVGDALATGSITIDDSGTILTITLVVGGALFDDSDAFTAPASFSSVTYSATLTTFTATPPGPGVGGLFGSGTGAGTVSGFIDGNPFSVNPNVSINCSYPGGVGQCGISFGEAGFTDIAGRDWRHTFDVTVALPEPTTAVLVVLGLAGLALRSRSA